MEFKNMYNNVEKFVLAVVILSIGSLFFLMDQSEEVELSDNISESFSNEGTVDVEITSLVNNTNMGNSVNDEAMATETVPTFNDNVFLKNSKAYMIRHTVHDIKMGKNAKINTIAVT